MVNRFAKAKKRLLRLQKQHWSHEVKLRMIRSSVYPTAFYGIELVLAPSHEIASLRTQVARAILGTACRTVSSAILLNVIPNLLYPFVRAIVASLKQAKQLLHALTGTEYKQFLSISGIRF